ncbi:MAG: enoyl-CoA hydratase [Rhizobiales bacterium PAR1]|nr:MAG: enoyl-CoA hydratase [Rhizobiales bacterium PAR1]
MEPLLIKREIADHIAVVTLNNPPVNAQSREFMEQLIRCFDEINEMPDVRVVVLTAEGQKVFSAGADIKARLHGHASPGDTYAHARRVRETSNCIMELNKPVIAAINGAALGAGLGLMLACDIYIVSENAQIGLPEIDVGLMGGARHTMRLMPHSIAREMILTGRRISGAELFRLGVVSACVPPDELMNTAMAMARNIARKSPAALRFAKRAINTVETMNLRDGYRFEQNLTIELSRHDDSREAMKAFVEKRDPVFKDTL